ncbi:MAG: hypothetical protein HUJ31_12720, partial [Pseudomonadales bacterium]|nr:hypothetical protein [Pseudomonadales bacterium]
EIITHFSNLDTEEHDSEEIDEVEAIASMKACIKGVLGRPKVAVATRFMEFRQALESSSLSADDPNVELLTSSPYFFLRLTVNILMNAAKQSTGAKLDNALGNGHVILPLVWDKLRDVEKWRVGHTYAEVYADGRSSSVSAIKSVLSKVEGFDYVPENLRTDAYIRAAHKLIDAHEGMNNFYNELTPLRTLAKMGTTIPISALGVCMTAILCVRLGNAYGVAHNAQSIAYEMLESTNEKRWGYYLNEVLPGEVKILNKLSADGPRKRWIKLVEDLSLEEMPVKHKLVARLLKASKTNRISTFDKVRQQLLRDYYGDAA